MAVSEETKKQYLPSIGIETHVQLSTKTKLFSAVGNDSRGAAPNSLISHIDTGMPGALPVLNQAAIEQCVRAALALNTQPRKFSRFERKHYFYPDLPKGYQITQLEDPIIVGGFLNVPSPEGEFKVEIERANLEEDAGKNTHPEGADYSLVDLNRAGTPLLEVVSRPDIHSAAQAKAFAREMWLTMKYSGVTDGDLYLGHVRFDVNISVSKEPSKLGTRSEIKNLNSFRSVEGAVAYEIDRQIELLEKGQKVIQETRGWDEAKQKSVGQRGKEEAQDYRYMPEPDIPPLDLDDQFIKDASAGMPVMPGKWREMISTHGLKGSETEILIDAGAESVNHLIDVSEAINSGEAFARYVANTIINIVLPFERHLAENKLKPSAYNRMKLYKETFRLQRENKISSSNAKTLIEKLLNPSTRNLTSEVEKQAEIDGLLQVSDKAEIEKIVSEVLAKNAKAAEDVKKGEMKAIGFLVGQVMAKSQGKANPQLAQDIIKKQLGL